MMRSLWAYIRSYGFVTYGFVLGNFRIRFALGSPQEDDEKREHVFKEDGQGYAQVVCMLGNSRCEALRIDDTKRLCHIRDKMHKKVWIAASIQPYYGLRSMRLDFGSSLLPKDVLPSLSTPFVEDILEDGNFWVI
nr:eukaryotic translation initiation factor 1A [Ipomoea batatas]